MSNNNNANTPSSESTPISNGGVSTSNSGANTPRNISIQPQQAAALAQALRKEIEHAKAAGDDIAKAKMHHAKAESIRQVLINYQSQQKAKQSSDSPDGPSTANSPAGTTNTNTPGATTSSTLNTVRPATSDKDQGSSNTQTSGALNSRDPSPAQSKSAVITIDKLNKVKHSLDQLESTIARLEEEKKNATDAAQVQSLEAEIEKLRPNVSKYQKLAHYFKNELLNRSNSRTPSPPTSIQSTSNLADSNTANNNGQGGSNLPPRINSATPPAHTTSQKSLPINSSLNRNISGTSITPTGFVPVKTNPNPPMSQTSLTNKLSSIPKLGGLIRPSIQSGPSSLSNFAHTMSNPTIKMGQYDNPNLTPTNIPDNGGRVMTKRKLADLVATLAATEGDVKPTVDNDVEELLLDLADEFVTSVTTFACRLAKHRKVKKVDLRDFQLHLERNWNIRVPGYSIDDTRAPRKLQPSTEYNQKVSNIGSSNQNSTNNK